MARRSRLVVHLVADADAERLRAVAAGETNGLARDEGDPVRGALSGLDIRVVGRVDVAPELHLVAGGCAIASRGLSRHALARRIRGASVDVECYASRRSPVDPQDEVRGHAHPLRARITISKFLLPSASVAL